jgi:hypothetical protein
MAKPIELNILRAGSVPLHINLVADHLPAPVRDALHHLIETRTELGQAEADLGSARGDAWAPANQRAEAARTAAAQALADFAGVNAASTTAIKDATACSFEAAVASAGEHLHAALDALADADRAAQLWHTVRPGKAALRFESRTSAESKVHMRLAMVRSDLRETVSQLPDALD